LLAGGLQRRREQRRRDEPLQERDPDGREEEAVNLDDALRNGGDDRRHSPRLGGARQSDGSGKRERPGGWRIERNEHRRAQWRAERGTTGGRGGGAAGLPTATGLSSTWRARSTGRRSTAATRTTTARRARARARS